MDRIDVIRRLIVRGSDELVYTVYQRFRADRVGRSGPSPGDHPPKTWSELADMAVAEGALSPREALLLLEADLTPDIHSLHMPRPPAPGERATENVPVTGRGPGSIAPGAIDASSNH